MSEVIPLLAVGNRSAALVTFIVYSLAVLGIAAGSHRLLSKRQFMAEYFLGSRNLGMWAFMFTFAATSASAGSFAGFPALVYAHGWSVGIWIAGYMTVPLIAMGLLGKRINRMARQADAITLPDLMHARFESRIVSLLATVLIVSLLSLYLIPQFKIASLILQELLADVSAWKTAVAMTGQVTSQLPLLENAEASYLLGLFLFSVMVILYTSFGGFRAVVWTDILQGVVMFLGVLVLLVLVLSQVGGLANATQQMAEMQTPELVTLRFERLSESAEGETRIPSETWFSTKEHGETQLYRTNEPTTFSEGNETSELVKAVLITGRVETERCLRGIPNESLDDFASRYRPIIEESKSYTAGAGQPGVYVSAPGPSESNANGFLPITIAFSFFVFWTFGAAGQPGNKVRLMAFDGTKTLKRAMGLLVVYFGLIYFSLVVIFCCGRILVPALDQTPDRIMPVLSLTVANNAGVPWLAGLLIAAPFAAAMSTVDSFMLMISSSLVRDVYQREINPGVSERTTKRLSYLCTVGVGLFAMVAAVNPPKFLQVIIIFASSGLASVFLMPIFYGLYWPRFNAAGAIAGMLGGFFVSMMLYVIGFLMDYFAGVTSLSAMRPWKPLEFDPMVWGILGSAVCGAIVCLLTPAPSPSNRRKYFGSVADG